MARSDRLIRGSERQRGATLVGYAVILSVMVVAGMSSLKVLEQNSEEFLADSGSSIGQPPPDRTEGVSEPLSPPSSWTRVEPGQATTTTVATTTTTAPTTTSTTSTTASSTSTIAPTTSTTAGPPPIFVAQRVGTHAPGLCLAAVSGRLTQIPCNDGASAVITAQAVPGGGTELRLAGGTCLGLPGTRSAGTQILEMPCGGSGSTWTLSATSPYVMENIVATADRGEPMCLDVPLASTSSGTPIVIGPCHGQAHQSFPLS